MWPLHSDTLPDEIGGKLASFFAKGSLVYTLHLFVNLLDVLCRQRSSVHALRARLAAEHALYFILAVLGKLELVLAHPRLLESLPAFHFYFF